MAILVTGAAGFVGSHFARVAHDLGRTVVALDDFSTSSGWPRLPRQVVKVWGDVGDRELISRLVKLHQIDTVVHFAGRIRVDESTRDPRLYFAQNLQRTTVLVDAVTAAATSAISFVLSSSAAVYGEPMQQPISEAAPKVPISPYGASKRAAELVIEAYGRARGLRWAALRYFNAAGAHPDGTLRERHDPETHLIPAAIDAAINGRAPLLVHGSDYETRDGTCERDFVHVMDLASAHLTAIDVLRRGDVVGALNLGSGRGATVAEVVAEVERATGRPLPRGLGNRRPGDPASLVADCRRAREVLGWQPERQLGEVVDDALRSRRS